MYLLTEEEAKTSKEPCFIWYSFEESVGYFEGTDAIKESEAICLQQKKPEN